MIYHLTEAGFGLCFEREPIAADGEVLFTFIGAEATRIGINGKFYPVKEGAARVPRAHLTEQFGVTAYTADGHRYHCDALAIVPEGGEGEVLLPLSDCESRLLLSLSARAREQEKRLRAVEDALARLTEECHGAPITFGGLYES
ncbi:MAG: hypothetical protein IJF73_00595 [Clostridia bacterium]|nr:hypothetical protein [Clostridia bacterium]